MSRQLAIFILLASFVLSAGAAQRDQASLLNDSNHFDPSTQLYTYSYILTNPAGSQAPLDLLEVKLEPGVDIVTNIKSPPGWRAFYSAEKGTLMWAATGYVDQDAADPTGNVPPSDYALAAGGSLPGFSFQSFSPPGSGLAITQSYAPLDSIEGAEDEAETNRFLSTLPEDNGYRLTTVVPVPDSDWMGNRRPAVDDFLVFANVQDKANFRGSALIVLRLAPAGESVDKASLQVYLNGSDVTRSFSWSDEYKGYAAVFAPGASPIQVGSNVLRTSITGIVPGTADKRAKDTDRLTFQLTL